MQATATKPFQVTVLVTFLVHWVQLRTAEVSPGDVPQIVKYSKEIDWQGVTRCMQEFS